MGPHELSQELLFHGSHVQIQLALAEKWNKTEYDRNKMEWEGDGASKVCMLQSKIGLVD